MGDPAWLPHPVRLMGAAIAFGERRLNRDDGCRADSACAGGKRLGVGGFGASESAVRGAALALLVIGAAAAAGLLAQRSPAASIALGATTIAARDLVTEVVAVTRALEAGELASARVRVARIVGRDTAGLDAAGVARAALETLAESACDGIVAPLFWFTLAGLPGALAFKAASTLDSMIGHREPRYLRFGAFAARTDDLLNFVPARLAALSIGLAAGRPGCALRIAWRDAPRHASPNAGWPEAALAAALDVRLGGSNTYCGIAHDGPLLNALGRLPNTTDIRRGLAIVARATGNAQLSAVTALA